MYNRPQAGSGRQLGSQIVTTPLIDVVSNRKPLDLSLFELARVLSR